MKTPGAKERLAATRERFRAMAAARRPSLTHPTHLTHLTYWVR